MGKLFGTDGIRGRAHEYPVTAEMAARLGRAVVSVFGASGRAKVLIGRDTRESGEVLEEGLVAGLLESGAEVVRLGVVPTPAVALLVRKTGATAAVMLTASHNPYQDNGMKVFGGDGFKLPDNLEAKLEDLLLGEGDARAVSGGSVTVMSDALDIYRESAKASVDGMDLSGLKLVLDAGNGAGYRVASEIFRDLGAEVIEMAVEPDGKNINHECGALHADGAGKLVLELGADLGVSLDGDADRVIFTDATGEIVSGDRTLAMCAVALHEAGKLKANTMVSTVMSNLGLDEAMREVGVSVLRSGVGDRLVLEKMRNVGLSFGGENSGHLIFSDHATTGDGIVSALQVCRMMKEKGKSLRELSAIMREYPSRLVNLPVSAKPPLEGLAKLQELISQAERSFGKEGRQLIRYSGTEKKIRVLVEHKDEHKVDMWIRKFSAAIEEEIG